MAPEPDITAGVVAFEGGGAVTRDATDVGILTVLAEELTAVVDMLQNHVAFRTERQTGGWQTFHATVAAEGRDVRVVATQAPGRGPRAADVAFDRLQRTFEVPLVLLVGTAGGVHPDVEVGDVVIADEVVYYDAFGGTADGPSWCGRTRPMAAPVRVQVDEFFHHYRGLVAAPDGEVVRVFRGPVASGHPAVPDADLVDRIRRLDEGTVAVETGAGGVGPAFYERIDHDAALRGWLAIRGISGRSDAAGGADRHQFAADNAALVADRLLPLLSLVEPA
jgi:adenosylhomocysteine nucleosidase